MADPVQNAACQSRFLCVEDGWISCEAPPGHDPESHEGAGHIWTDDDAAECERYEAWQESMLNGR